MLGSDLMRFLEDAGANVTGFTRDNLDLSTSEAIAKALNRFDVVVNCIAFTKVDLAESEPEAAAEANLEIPRRIIDALGSGGPRMIHISTDYVFSGDASHPYDVYSQKEPLGVYGKTKSLGEDIWLNGSMKSQVIRTAWLYGASGSCFPKTIARKLLAGEELTVIDDQIGSPTWTWEISAFIRDAVMEPLESRILHGVAGGVTTWFGFAQAIAKELDDLAQERIPESVSSFQDLIYPVSTHDYPAQAKRPKASVLVQSKVGGHRIFDWRRGWKLAAAVVLEELLRPEDK